MKAHATVLPCAARDVSCGHVAAVEHKARRAMVTATLKARCESVLAAWPDVCGTATRRALTFHTSPLGEMRFMITGRGRAFTRVSFGHTAN